MRTLLSLSIAILAGLLMTRVAKPLKLPSVTAYLVSTLGFPMRDATDRIRTIFALDRLSDAPYTDWEIETVRSIRELLKLFHRLLFTCADDEAAQLTSRTELQTLTPREMEIVNLLEQGITPANIAHILHITVPTTNRHIYNIYKKVNVNSRAELMAKIK